MAELIVNAGETLERRVFEPKGFLITDKTRLTFLNFVSWLQKQGVFVRKTEEINSYSLKDGVQTSHKEFRLVLDLNAHTSTKGVYIPRHNGDILLEEGLWFVIDIRDDMAVPTLMLMNKEEFDKRYFVKKEDEKTDYAKIHVDG